MRRTVLITIAATLLLCGCSAPPPPAEVVDRFSVLDAASLRQQGRWQEALALYQALIDGSKTDPWTLAESLDYAGLCHAKLGDHAAAVLLHGLHHEPGHALDVVLPVE